MITAVYEPYSSEKSNTVKTIKKIHNLCDNDNTVIRVINNDNSEQIIFQGLDPERRINAGKLGFSGHFGVISLRGGKPEHLYLGKGTYISYGEISLRTAENNTSAEIQILADGTYRILNNNPVMLDMRGNKKRIPSF